MTALMFYKVELAVSTPASHPVARLPLWAASPWHLQLPLWATQTSSNSQNGGDKGGKNANSILTSMQFNILFSQIKKKLQEHDKVNLKISP